jgi:hypothetical protein
MHRLRQSAQDTMITAHAAHAQTFKLNEPQRRVLPQLVKIQLPSTSLFTEVAPKQEARLIEPAQRSRPRGASSA